MPKLKTRKSVAKRIKITAKGKIKYNKPARRHLLQTKSTKTKRQLRKQATLRLKTKVDSFKAEVPYAT